MKILGSDIIVMFEVDGIWQTLAYGLNCELDVNVETISVSSPLSGKWGTKKKKRMNWNGSSSHLLSEIRSAVDVKELIKSTTPIKILIGSVEIPRKDYTDYFPDGRFFWKGDALVTRLTVTGSKGTLSTMSIEFVGTGEPEWDDIITDGIFDRTFDHSFE